MAWHAALGDPSSSIDDVFPENDADGDIEMAQTDDFEDEFLMSQAPACASCSHYM